MSVFDKKYQSIWDSLTSLIDEKETDDEEQDYISAVYIDDDGNEYTIDELPDDEETEEGDEETVSESIRKVKVVRGGKRMKKFKTNKEGFRVKMVNGRPKEVKMSTKERMIRKKAAKKAALKGKSKRKLASKKRARSIKKR